MRRTDLGHGGRRADREDCHPSGFPSPRGEASSLDAAISSLVRRVVREEVRQLLEALVLPAIAAVAARHVEPVGDELLSPKKAAAMLDVTPATVREWIRSGQLPARHAGRLLRVRAADLAGGLPKVQGDDPTDAQMDAKVTEHLERRRRRPREAPNALCPSAGAPLARSGSAMLVAP